jgi:hypothetical protein
MNIITLLVLSASIYSVVLVVLLLLLVSKPRNCPVRKKVKTDLKKIKDQINGE